MESHIEVTPRMHGGKPRIQGTRIRVYDIALWHKRLGLSVEQIVSRFPNLTLADVHAALLYYDEHSDEIQLHLVTADSLGD